MLNKYTTLQCELRETIIPFWNENWILEHSKGHINPFWNADPLFAMWICAFLSERALSEIWLEFYTKQSLFLNKCSSLKSLKYAKYRQLSVVKQLNSCEI